jgi:hypothetical protein
MVTQAPETDARVRGFGLDLEERQEAEYHRFLGSTVKPVEDAIAALATATSEGTCIDWATTHREALVQAAKALRESEPPSWLAVYRNSFLAAVDRLVQAADCWLAADSTQGDKCARLAAEVLDSAEDLADGLL